MSRPKVTSLGTAFTFTWDEERIIAKVERIYQHSRGDVSAEITFLTTLHDPPAMLHHSRCSNLLGTRLRNDIAKDCADKFPALSKDGWLGLVETCLETVVSRSRQGEPVELILDVKMEQTSDFLLYPLLHRDDINILFGLGGSLKSTLSAWIAMKVALGMDGDAENVGILDWESTSHAWARRLREVATGLNEQDPAPNIIYRRMHQPLADDVESVYRIGTEHSVGLWILDSAMWACGGRPEEAEYAMALFRAVRSLRGTVLMIAHQNNDESTKRPYGNVMWVNAPRSVIQVQRSNTTVEDNQVVVGLTQRKVNYGKRFAPMAYRATFHQSSDEFYTEGDKVDISHANIMDEEDLAEGQSWVLRITHLLRNGRMAKTDIPAELKANSTQVKTVLTTIDRLVRTGRLERLADGMIGLAAGSFATPEKHVSGETNVISFPAHE